MRLPPKEKVWRLRHSILSFVPIPIRIPAGAVWLAWDDELSERLYLGIPFEESERMFVNRLLLPGDIVFDVGAHHGLYVLEASKKTGSKGAVFAFEPSPREFLRLRWHVLINRCSNVHTEPFALSSKDGTVELFVCLNEHTGMNSLRAPPGRPTSKVMVRAVALDGYVESNEIRLIDFMKIDVEGAELEVLKGSTSILGSELPPIIMCEVQDVRTREWGYHASDIRDLLEIYGYRAFSVTENGRLQVCPKKNVYEENLVFVPEARLPKVATLIEASHWSNDMQKYPLRSIPGGCSSYANDKYGTRDKNHRTGHG